MLFTATLVTRTRLNVTLLILCLSGLLLSHTCNCSYQSLFSNLYYITADYAASKMFWDKENWCNVQCTMYNVQCFVTIFMSLFFHKYTLSAPEIIFKKSWKFKVCEIRHFVWHIYRINCAHTRGLSFVLRRIVTHWILNVLKQIGFCCYFLCSLNEFLKKLCCSYLCCVRYTELLCSVHRTIVFCTQNYCVLYTELLCSVHRTIVFCTQNYCVLYTELLLCTQNYCVL
jgi:hypothetical protein